VLVSYALDRVAERRRSRICPGLHEAADGGSCQFDTEVSTISGAVLAVDAGLVELFSL
jgi:hypothetical protein